MTNSLGILLTHWCQDKWSPFSRRDYQFYFMIMMFWILIQISLKFVPSNRFHYEQTLVKIKAWRRRVTSVSWHQWFKKPDVKSDQRDFRLSWNNIIFVLYAHRIRALISWRHRDVETLSLLLTALGVLNKLLIQDAIPVWYHCNLLRETLCRITEIVTTLPLYTDSDTLILYIHVHVRICMCLSILINGISTHCFATDYARVIS